jgi:hypothetical protein
MIRPMLVESYEVGMATLREALAADIAGRAAGADRAAMEPAVPISQGRHLATTA